MAVEIEIDGDFVFVTKACETLEQAMAVVAAIEAVPAPEAYQHNQDTGNPLVAPQEDYGSGVSPQERADTGISDLQIPLNPQVVADCAERALQALVDEAQEMGLYDNEPATPIEPRLDGIVDERMAASFAAYCKTGNCED